MTFRWGARIIWYGILGLFLSVVLLIVWSLVSDRLGLGPHRALHHSVLEGSLSDIEELVRAGHDPNAKEDGISPLQLAVFMRAQGPDQVPGDSAAVVEALLNAGALPGAPNWRPGDRSWDPPRWLGTHREVFESDPRPLNLALHALSDPKIAPAVGREDLERTIELLLIHGAVVRSVPAFRRLATGAEDIQNDDLYKASRSGNTQVMQVLLENGASAGEDHVMWAIQWGRLEAVRFLLDQDVVLSPDSTIQAAMSCEPEILGLLLERGVPPDATKEGMNFRVRYESESGGRSFAWNPSALEWAISQKCAEAVLVLLEFGADPSRVSASGSTPLHSAAVAESVDIAKLLTGHGANPSATNRAGRTPLHLAAARGTPEMASSLISMGADTEIRDASGLTALQVAAEAGRPLVVRAIKEAKVRKEEQHAKARAECAHRAQFSSVDECLHTCDERAGQADREPGGILLGYARYGFFNALAVFDGETLAPSDGLAVSKGMQLLRVLELQSPPTEIAEATASWTKLGIDHCVPVARLSERLAEWTILSTARVPFDVRSPSVEDQRRFYELETECVDQGDPLPEDKPPCVSPQLLAVSDVNGDGVTEYWHTAPYIWDTGFQVSEEASAGIKSILYACPGCSD